MKGALAAALLVCALANALLFSLRPAPADPLSIRLEAESAVETASLFGLGMRRLAADLGLIRMLQYYGSAEEAREDAHQHEGHDHKAHPHAAPFDPAHPERSYGGGEYPQLGPRAMRILDVDPSFGYAALYAAGALAFNLNRPDEALAVLAYGLKRDPGNIQFVTYAAAIGFHKHGDVNGVVRILEPALASPDCPTMIKSMMAFLFKKSGRTEKAVGLYREILASSRDEGYRAMAAHALAELGQTP